jgi:Protoporphyrinogen oxidase
MPLLTTGILSLPGRVRAGLELFVPRRGTAPEESVAEFSRRRFGREAYDWLIEPLLSGIYAGDGETLSLESTFPQMRETELRDGSLLKPLLFGRTWRAGILLGNSYRIRHAKGRVGRAGGGAHHPAGRRLGPPRHQG